MSKKYIRSRSRGNKILKLLVKCVILLLVYIAAVILFLLLIWYRGQQAEPKTGGAAVQRQAEPLVIETQEPATEGSITIYTPDGMVYGYFGEIDIVNDGKDGSQIDIVLTGWLVGEAQESEVRQ
ncbi:MAG: hypothetical protein NC548_40680 [Lachnospiraceae bacterium]|nr:hypothetical protein [Lachnospiraceae bacterium]